MKRINFKKLTSLIAISCIAFGLASSSAHAAGDAKAPHDMQWPHEGVFGTYDIPAVQRGYQIYRENCSACHSMKYMSYRNLAEIGFTEDEIKTIAKEYTYIDGPNDEGDMFERPGKTSDRFKGPYANEEQARYANNGALPPDMSLLVKARANGEDYIYSILTGYVEAPEGEDLGAGQHWNEFMLGHKIAMAPPLADGTIVYSDGTEATLEQAAMDVVQFLAWASEPTADKRKAMGFKIMAYLLIFSILMYMTKVKIWHGIKKKK